jgi:hypothetical protein
MQYANSLIGRQFKIIVKTNAFHVHDLVDPVRYAFIKAVGELSALIWYPEIQNMDEYLVSSESDYWVLFPINLPLFLQADIEIAVANVLDIAAQLDATKIISKIKYHLLVHAVDDIRRFGPIVGVATEGYESFNVIFRLCSILSNHLAPSRDIAYQLAEQETLKHLLFGGQWYKADKQSWEKPGSHLTQYVAQSKFLRGLFGLEDDPRPSRAGKSGSLLLFIPTNGLTIPYLGATQLAPLKADNPKARTRESRMWNQLRACHAIAADARWESPTLQWFQCRSVTTASGDECGIGAWVFFKFNGEMEPDSSSVSVRHSCLSPSCY